MANIQSTLTGMEKHHSLFEKEIRTLETPVIAIFKNKNAIQPVLFDKVGATIETKDAEKVKSFFPQTTALSKNAILHASGANTNPAKGKRVAVLFSGGPASGGHNVVVGLRQALGADNVLLGVKAGPKGLIEGNLFEISMKDIDVIKNTGGFDFLGSDRTKIKTPEQFEAVKKTCRDNKLDAIVVIGGDDSNTNAAILAERLISEKVQVIGVPKTIDGDLQAGKNLPISFGFDTATKIYAEMVGNILQDTPSSRKYWHFIKLMGRAASHVALEVGLQTKPAVCLISEEVAEKKLSLSSIVEDIAKKVIARDKKGIHHGVVLVPEGLVEFIPEMNSLLSELNDLVAHEGETFNALALSEKRALVAKKLTGSNQGLFTGLPEYIQEMLLLDRDSHGNVQVSQIPTEKLLIDMVAKRVKELDSSVKFSGLNHFFGYEGRCGAPSLFDAAFTLNLGLGAGSLILAGKTGYMISISDFDKGGEVLAIPLTGLINLERRHGKDEMVIEKALVKTNSPAFLYFVSRREEWAKDDIFTSPGPRQLWGPVAKQVPFSVAINQDYSQLGFEF
jgi:pyrophosphate--fructose-6-phosphate 1-phosphotransferase